MDSIVIALAINLCVIAIILAVVWNLLFNKRRENPLAIGRDLGLGAKIGFLALFWVTSKILGVVFGLLLVVGGLEASSAGNDRLIVSLIVTPITWIIAYYSVKKLISFIILRKSARVETK